MDERIATLEAQVATLRATVERMTQSPTHAPSLRGDRRCPLCRCERILYVRSIKEENAANKEVPLGLTSEHVFWKGIVRGGLLSVYVCSECGLCEWYARDIDKVKIGDKVQLLERSDPDPDGGPYR